jgi:uncharacterized protein
MLRRLTFEFLKMKPDLSVIIPVLYEGDRIRSCLDSLAHIAEDIPYEVIVVDGDPRGSTLQALTQNYAYATGVRSQAGRGIQLNTGAQAASGTVLIFLHADTRLPDRAFHQILETCSQKQWVGGAFDLAIASPRFSLKTIGKVASWRSRLTRIPYGDQAIFLCRKVFEQIQGFPEIPIMEDVELMLRLKRRGDKIRIVSAAVMTSPRRWEKEGILRCTLRNWSLITLYFCGVHPNTLVRWYRPSSFTDSAGL